MKILITISHLLLAVMHWHRSNLRPIRVGEFQREVDSIRSKRNMIKVYLPPSFPIKALRQAVEQHDYSLFQIMTGDYTVLQKRTHSPIMPANNVIPLHRARSRPKS